MLEHKGYALFFIGFFGVWVGLIGFLLSQPKKKSFFWDPDGWITAHDFVIYV
jgi:hypothetical protein